MKKKGATLVTVLIIFAALIIIATSISSVVINTTKLNKRYSDTIDLELAAKSAVNMVKGDFISKVKNKEIKTLENVNEYIGGITAEKNIKSFLEGYSNKNIDLTVNLELNSNSDGKKTLKISSLAKNKDKASVEKIEEQSLILNIASGDNNGDNNNESGSTNENLVFNKLFNIGKDITSFGDSKQNTINQFEYGGQCCDLTVNNGQNAQKPPKNESLSKINIKLSLNIINNIISKYDTSKAVDHNRSNISIENETIVYKKLDGDNLNINVKKSNILFQEGGNASNDSKVQNLDESEIFINGKANFSKLNISNMNNSKLIINGDLEIQNEFSINQQNSSSGNNLILINGDFKINGNGPKINLNNSIIIVVGDFTIQNQLNLEMKNSAIICIENDKNENLVYKGGNFNFGTNPTITNYNGSYLYCSGNFKVGNVMNINSYGNNTVESEFVNKVINEFLTVSKN